MCFFISGFCEVTSSQASSFDYTAVFTLPFKLIMEWKLDHFRSSNWPTGQGIGLAWRCVRFHSPLTNGSISLTRLRHHVTSKRHCKYWYNHWTGSCLPVGILNHVMFHLNYFFQFRLFISTMHGLTSFDGYAHLHREQSIVNFFFYKSTTLYLLFVQFSPEYPRKHWHLLSTPQVPK